MPSIPALAATPNLSEFDVILINTSAGKDSLVMLEAVATEINRQRFTGQVVAVFADLGDRVEWPGTRELAERQVARYGWRFEVAVRTDGLDLLAGIEKRGMWPSSTARYCTSDWKRAPIRRLMTRLADEHRAVGGTGPCRILNCMGLRAEESSARAKKSPYELDTSASNGRRQVYNWLPVFHWTAASDVWPTIRTLGLAYHPAYDVPNVDRLSCAMCVLAKPSQIEATILALPGIAREYAAAERRMGHLFKQNWSIADAVNRLLGGDVA